MTTWLLCALCALALQDRPTPPGGSVERFAAPHPPMSGTAGCIGYATGQGSAGRSHAGGTALGLKAEAKLVAATHGAMHAIAEIPVRPSSAPTPRGTAGGPTTRSGGPRRAQLSRTTDRPDAERRAPRRLVYGFTAIAEHSLVSRPDSRPDRAELYLYDRESDSDSVEGGDFYHAIVERGNLIEESGDRRLLEIFVAAGRESWLRPFEQKRLDSWPPLPGVPHSTEVVGPRLEQTVRDLERARRGRPRRQLRALTSIERRDTSGGASSFGSARSDDRDRRKP